MIPNLCVSCVHWLPGRICALSARAYPDPESKVVTHCRDYDERTPLDPPVDEVAP